MLVLPLMQQLHLYLAAIHNGLKQIHRKRGNLKIDNKNTYPLFDIVP
jgi:hypothetical protein